MLSGHRPCTIFSLSMKFVMQVPIVTGLNSSLLEKERERPGRGRGEERGRGRENPPPP